MALRDSSASWGLVSRILHWLMAIMLISMLGLGVYMVEFEVDLIARFKLTQLHKSFGFTVFLLGLIRLIWRLTPGVRPLYPPDMKAWEKKAARASHLAFYALMIAMPLSGWLLASASPLNDADAFPFRVANRVFDLFELPDPFDPGSKSLAGTLAFVHTTLAVGLAALLLVHVSAALKHACIDRDDVLSRMLRG